MKRPAINHPVINRPTINFSVAGLSAVQLWQRPVWQQLLLFKTGWLLLVLLPQWSLWPLLGIAMVLMFALSADKLLLTLMLAVSGSLFDAGLTIAGLFTFLSAGSFATSPLPMLDLPPWLVLLWLWFSLFWLQLFNRWLTRPWQAALAGAVLGPLAYWGGARISDGLVLAAEPALIAVHTLGWALLLGLTQSATVQMSARSKTASG